MKKIAAILLILTSSACYFNTEYGKCISPFEDGRPELEYEISTWNTVWSALGLEMVFPPVLWTVKCGKCPVGKKVP